MRFRTVAACDVTVLNPSSWEADKFQGSQGCAEELCLENKIVQAYTDVSPFHFEVREFELLRYDRCGYKCEILV